MCLISYNEVFLKKKKTAIMKFSLDESKKGALKF